MTSFENIEIEYFGVQSAADVLASIRRIEPCRADPLSPHCHFNAGRDDYLLRDRPGKVVCEGCPVFDARLQQMTSDWEEWVLALQEAYA